LKNSGSPITWLIDLDNTLHNASHAIFPDMHLKMNAYMADVLGDGVNPADDDTVDVARLFYWKKYGATLLGLMKHHNVDPTDFLHYAHQFENLADMLRYETGLKHLLNRLPGRKILFTNAPYNYAQQVVRHLGLQRHFDQHMSIESMRVHGYLRPKPSRWLLKKIIAKQKLSASRCVLIEDTRGNLRTAKQLGMKTVWVTQYVSKKLQGNVQDKKRFSRASFIDIKIRSIKQLPAHLSRLSFNK
jgi:putative hydrolase of the HAD superfamily